MPSSNESTPIAISPTESKGLTPMGWRRYVRLGGFFARMLGHVLLRELVGRRFGLSPKASRRKLARAYRDLSRQLGGLTVKLGQFLSLRNDLLPLDVTDELGQLQDRMPSAPFESIAAIVEQDLGRPLGELFPAFDPEPLGCASLAQVHGARLPDGSPVVVKVLRPETPALFRSDLKMTAALVRILRQSRRLRREVDLDGMLKEFTDVTLRELDMVGEGRNSERFAHDFRDDPWVDSPRIDWQRSGRQTLTMENAGRLKASDFEGLEAAGIDRALLARQIVRIFLRQIFVHHFVHADPHPGNLFIVPNPAGSPRPFRIVFIDFGMVVDIPEKERTWLREFLIGLGFRDAQRIVRAYAEGGLLRPEVDIERMTEMTEILLERHQELLLGLSPDFAQGQTRSFFAEYADLLEGGYPFRIPMDLLFMYRALGAFGSLAKRLDPEVDLSAEAAPFAARFLWQALRTDLDRRLGAVESIGATLSSRPVELERVLIAAHQALRPPPGLGRWWGGQRSNIVQASLSPRDRRAIQRFERSVSRLTTVMAACGLLMAGAFLASVFGGPGSGLREGLGGGGRELAVGLAAVMSFLLGWSSMFQR